MGKAALTVAGSVIWGVLAMEMTPGEPMWVFFAVAIPLLLLQLWAQEQKAKEEQKRLDDLELAKHRIEAKALIAAQRHDERRRKHDALLVEAKRDNTRLGPEDLKAFEKPEAPNGQQPMDSRL